MREHYIVYDMSDNKCRYDVIAAGPAHAIGIVENHSGTCDDHLVVCTSKDIPITDPYNHITVA